MFLFHGLIALITYLTCALCEPIQARDATPVASTAYSIPSIMTPARATSPQYSQSPLQHSSFAVASTTNFGKMADPSNTYTLFRDGGGSCAVANRTLWFFCDTLAYRTSDGRFMGAASNSISLATNFSQPAVLTDASSTPATGILPAIPWTSAEAAVAGNISQRYALWVYTNCVPTGNNTAVHFWQVNKFSSPTSHKTLGNTMAQYTLDLTTNQFTVTRNSQITFASPTYGYGSFANVVVNGTAYLYGIDTSYSRNDVHLATAPVNTITDLSTWQYYNASSQTWNSTMPIPNARQQSAAVIQNSIPFSSGTIFFSEYHNAFLLVFFDNWADSTFRVLSAPSPVGPWTTNNLAIWAMTPGPRGYDYGGLAHPIYYTNNAQAGKSLMLHYSYQNTSGTYTIASQLTFA
ncbi:uncharacterized protein V1513DRAFT_74719 [Lipomyces chichibuensis]|uniref:uncharacterized protein n=1 Tax=Lipomyces chichibuensis TaxID=1546026 RepID=UPI0033430908